MSNSALPSLHLFKRPESASPRARRRDAGPWIISSLFLLGAAALFGLVFGERLRPRIPVETQPALFVELPDAEPVSASDESFRAVAQASGWIEPDPYPIRVPVRVDGFVADVPVLEGQFVRTGDLLAALDATNFMLAAARAEAEWRAARAEADESDRELARLESEVRASEARLAAAQDQAARAQALTDAAATQAERTATRLAAAEAEAMLEAARLAYEAHRHRCEQLRAAVARAAAELDQARLDLERTRVYAPIDGVVLRREAAPGMKRMVAMDDPESSTIVTLYDPRRLQVRADVPLAEVGRVETGMAARVVTAAFPNRVFTAVVTRITGEADLARNTLQVKVALRDPDPRMRPEMLCRVEFLAPDQAAPLASGARTVWIPAAARRTDAEGRSVVWVMDVVRGTAHPRPAELAREERGGWIRVLDGVRPGERVIVSPIDRLTPGVRVQDVKGVRS